MEEQNNNIQEQKKKGNGGLVGALLVIIVLLIVVIGVLVAKPDLITNMKGNDSETTESGNSVDATDATDEIVTDDEIKPIDLTKSLNTENSYRDATETCLVKGFALKVNDDKKSATLTVDATGKKSVSQITTGAYSEDDFIVTISGFTKKIKSALVCAIGQDVVGTRFFFVMEDGTVDYVNLFEKKTNPDGTIYYVASALDKSKAATINSISEVSGVVKLYGAGASIPEGTGYYTTLAAKKDGSFFDLNKYIK